MGGKQQQARASGDRLAEPPPAWEQTSIGCSTEMLFGSATDAEGQSQPACAQLSLVRGVGRSVPALPPSFAPVLPTTVQPVTPGGKQIAHAMSQVLSPPMPQVYRQRRHRWSWHKPCRQPRRNQRSWLSRLLPLRHWACLAPTLFRRPPSRPTCSALLTLLHLRHSHRRP